MSDWDEHRKANPLTCVFCDKTDSTVNMWCGAPWSNAHRACAEIAGKGITKWLRRQLHFREEFDYRYSQQRGWYCAECEGVYDFGEGRTCHECGKEMKVLFTSEGGDSEE